MVFNGWVKGLTYSTSMLIWQFSGLLYRTHLPLLRKHHILIWHCLFDFLHNSSLKAYWLSNKCIFLRLVIFSLTCFGYEDHNLRSPWLGMDPIGTLVLNTSPPQAKRAQYSGHSEAFQNKFIWWYGFVWTEFRYDSSCKASLIRVSSKRSLASPSPGKCVSSSCSDVSSFYTLSPTNLLHSVIWIYLLYVKCRPECTKRIWWIR